MINLNNVNYVAGTLCVGTGFLEGCYGMAFHNYDASLLGLGLTIAGLSLIEIYKRNRRTDNLNSSISQLEEKLNINSQ